MDFQILSAKQILINFLIALMIPFIHWFYGDAWDYGDKATMDMIRGILIFAILLLGMIGGIRELLDLRYIIKGDLAWFFLTLLATACHIMLYLSAMEYLGFDLSGLSSSSENTLLVVGSLLFTFYFLYELLFIMSYETKSRDGFKRKFSWSDFLLAIYAAFGSVYIWDILLGDVGFEFQNPAYFIFAELLPAILLFFMLILPFKRYDLMENHGLSRTKNEKHLLNLSYFAMLVTAILPRVMESIG